MTDTTTMQHGKQMKENNAAILSPGEKIHVIHRRYFEKDARRHFVGEVESYEHGIARASGYVFVVDDLNKHMFVKRPDRRTKLIPISSGEVIVNVISETVDLERVAYEIKDRSLRVTDGSDWSMDVKEFGWG
jgi:reverse gyrase